MKQITRSFDGNRIADLLAVQIGSWNFIIAQSILMAIWFLLNSVGWFVHWDSYPFVFLNLFMSMEAAYATPIILISSNRQQQRDTHKREQDSLSLQRIENIETMVSDHVARTVEEQVKQLAQLRLIMDHLTAK